MHKKMVFKNTHFLSPSVSLSLSVGLPLVPMHKKIVFKKNTLSLALRLFFSHSSILSLCFFVCLSWPASLSLFFCKSVSLLLFVCLSDEGFGPLEVECQGPGWTVLP